MVVERRHAEVDGDVLLVLDRLPVPAAELLRRQGQRVHDDVLLEPADRSDAAVLRAHDDLDHDHHDRHGDDDNQHDHDDHHNRAATQLHGGL
jgi:hypothetical protein